MAREAKVLHPDSKFLMLIDLRCTTMLHFVLFYNARYFSLNESSRSSSIHCLCCTWAFFLGKYCLTSFIYYYALHLNLQENVFISRTQNLIDEGREVFCVDNIKDKACILKEFFLEFFVTSPQYDIGHLYEFH